MTKKTRGRAVSSPAALNSLIEAGWLHRYHLAKRFVEGKDVLILSGADGSGAGLLAETARSVIGLDASIDVITNAQSTFPAKNISFRLGSTEHIPLPAASADVVIYFGDFKNPEVNDVFIKEMKRVLRTGGIFIISLPEATGAEAAVEVSVKPQGWGLVENGLGLSLKQYFAHVSTYGQKTGFGSVIREGVAERSVSEEGPGRSQTIAGVEPSSYTIGIASDEPVDSLNNGSFLLQDAESGEPIIERMGLEAQWAEVLMADIDQISGQVDALQRGNMLSKAPFLGLIKRLLLAKLLYALSEVKMFSVRRRNRFLKSAEKRDPMLLSRKVDQFCVDYYNKISSNKIIAASRSIISAQSGVRVTAIIPNYNHARYLPERLDSILAQTYPLIEIIVLDDCSTDESRSVIESYVKRYPDRVSAVYNTRNSGNVFHQWQKGHSLAKGDLIWICESDDFCEPTFVERMISAFRDPSVMMAFGRIQFANSTGEYFAGLDHYREESEPGIWDARLTRPAAEWFRKSFGVKNVIANVGGCLWRRFEISEQVWEEARNYKIMGDWYLYSVIAGGGQIAYEPSAVSYFRIHENNTSGSSAQRNPEYYKEYARLMVSLKQRWDIPNDTLNQFIDTCRSVSTRSGLRTDEFDKLVNYRSLSKIQKEQIHVLVGILGFSFGGGEIFPIHLANALRRRGIMVSILQMHDAEDHPDVRRMLDPGIPVYTANTVRDMGASNFIRDAGISLVHSHVANVEGFLLDKQSISIPFISTLHGSYEAMQVSRGRIARWSKRIDKFAYTADRNLNPFDGIRMNGHKFVKIKNAMPVDEIEFPKTRAQLGIAADAVVFTLVARGAEGKGWVEAVRAYRLLRERRPDVPMALMMVGEGPATDDAKRLAAADPTIHFLGFVKEVYGLYRISDVALIPTRFPGESYPLCLIQALQVGVPCVSTDIGEIKAMSQINGQQAGIIIANQRNNEQFVIELSNAMEKILEKDVRDDFKEKAKVLGATYDIDVLAGEYIDHYRSVLASK
ncbi:glycosyltransferase [Agrobacterium sp. NPDC058088]|uniref:glycosyltransferase n=1 Tax=Agrobacterium sp. NPDC058088 TaxID=3346335 RepID=UPI0036D7ADFD